MSVEAPDAGTARGAALSTTGGGAARGAALSMSGGEAARGAASTSGAKVADDATTGAARGNGVTALGAEETPEEPAGTVYGDGGKGTSTGLVNFSRKSKSACVGLEEDSKKGKEVSSKTTWREMMIRLV